MDFSELWTLCSGIAVQHWPGIAFIIFITVIAQTLKSRIFSRELAAVHRPIFWCRRAFPVLLLLLGIIPGLTWPGAVTPGVETLSQKVWYFMACAGISILGFNVFRQWIKKKYDVDLDLSSVNPPPRKDE
jgi:hypothetical protein